MEFKLCIPQLRRILANDIQMDIPVVGNWSITRIVDGTAFTGKLALKFRTRT